ncbi:MAG: hypothetical protein Q8755_02615, partial [Candidatus Phytoplasma australasiaticum]|nr:hypothetical protein [Candidatus Phytoplasma australasiaticum]
MELKQEYERRAKLAEVQSNLYFDGTPSNPSRRENQYVRRTSVREEEHESEGESEPRDTTYKQPTRYTGMTEKEKWASTPSYRTAEDSLAMPYQPRCLAEVDMRKPYRPTVLAEKSKFTLRIAQAPFTAKT